MSDCTVSYSTNLKFQFLKDDTSTTKIPILLFHFSLAGDPNSSSQKGPQQASYNGIAARTSKPNGLSDLES